MILESHTSMSFLPAQYMVDTLAGVMDGEHAELSVHNMKKKDILSDKMRVLTASHICQRKIVLDTLSRNKFLSLSRKNCHAQPV